MIKTIRGYKKEKPVLHEETEVVCSKILTLLIHVPPFMQTMKRTGWKQVTI